jgi:hypothetical protein
MGFFGFDFLVVLLVLFGGNGHGGRDLLDLMPTDAYWQAKHVAVTVGQLEADAGPTVPPEHLDLLIHDLQAPEFKTRDAAKRKIYAMGPAALPTLKGEEASNDPEVKTVATELVTRLEAHEKEREVRRLMAIRTLGERKEQGAVELLKGLEGSKELFVSEYAARAVARIEGKEFAVPDRRAAVAGDLKVVPGEASIVGQCVGITEKPVTIEGLVDSALEMVRTLPPGAMGDASKIPTKGVMIHRLVVGMLQVADRIGDVRFDGITVEVSKDVGPSGGSAVLVLRGEYDRDAVIEALQAMASAEGMGNASLKVTDEGGVKEIEEGESATMGLLPSNEQLVVLMAGDRQKTLLPLKAEVLGALKSGKGALEQNAALGALLKKVDTQSPLWVVAQLNADMRKEKLFEGIETLTVGTKFEKEGTSFSVTGEGSDAELVKGSAEELKSDIAAGIVDMQAVMAQQKQFQPMLDFLQSLKVESGGTQATLSGSIQQSLVEAAMQETGSAVMFSGIPDDDADDGGATTRP